MEIVSFGRTGLKVSKLCFGTMTIGSSEWKQGTTMAEVAFAWVLAKEAICCPIVGPASVSQLDGYVEALDFDLSRDEIAFLDGLYRPRDVINGQIRNPMPRHLGGVQTDS